MARPEDIETLLDALYQAPPSAYLREIDKYTAGIRAILKYLEAEGGEATAGSISRYMGVSTARVAVLLKKMEAKGLLEKKKNPEDGRVVVVCLSPRGRSTAEGLRRGIYRQLGAVIDTVGMERMMEFAAISREIHAVMDEFPTTLLDKETEI